MSTDTAAERRFDVIDYGRTPIARVGIFDTEDERDAWLQGGSQRVLADRTQAMRLMRATIRHARDLTGFHYAEPPFLDDATVVALYPEAFSRLRRRRLNYGTFIRKLRKRLAGTFDSPVELEYDAFSEDADLYVEAVGLNVCVESDGFDEFVYGDKATFEIECDNFRGHRRTVEADTLDVHHVAGMIASAWN